MVITKIKKFDGRSSDLAFHWFTRAYGDEWERWRCYAATWMTGQHTSTTSKLSALTMFFERYLVKHASYAVNPLMFFSGYNGHHCSTEEYIGEMKKTISTPLSLTIYLNYTIIFVDWIIEQYYPAADDRGVNQLVVRNPFSRSKIDSPRSETVRNPLPYSYIEQLRHILCPSPTGNFQDWKWAQQRTGQAKQSGDWFEVDPKSIDKNDLDCVWRTKEVLRHGKKVSIFQIWSPVKAMVIFIKLHLPLRTYQVRMLDSGEADTWRYQCGTWVPNSINSFALGTQKRAFTKGVFKRIYNSFTGQFSTGLYINTNKTRDQNTEEVEKGYIIPWQNESVLYWLEKLRNWQEKYNPIKQPTDCKTLLKKHLSATKTEEALNCMGEYCFLFRDASGKGDDRLKPIQDYPLGSFWYALLFELECQLFARRVTLESGDRLKLVQDYPDGTSDAGKSSTLFPLHSLRVSLITAYTMDTDLPLPVISKLLAGHTRLMMTIYYTKITPSVMSDKMDEAHFHLKEKEHKSLKVFLKDAELNQIQCKTAYHNDDTMTAALANRNPVGWEERHHGLCLVGGNTVMSDESSMLGGCWNGGELIKDAHLITQRVYSAVPHGPENCVRCRFFITDARYLPALNAHFNHISFKASQAANIAVELEAQKEELEDEMYFAEEQSIPFTKQALLQQMQRRLEKQLVEADEYAKDWIATFRLISRIMQIEAKRVDGENNDKLIAVGTSEDLKHSLKFFETESELLHLSLICEDAEFYPDLQDELRKTPAIQKRSTQLNRVLMKKGFRPIFMEMDEKQQLVAGNAMLRHMAKMADPEDKLEGYRKVASYLEAEEYLLDIKLLKSGIDELAMKVFNFESFSDRALLELK